MHSRHELLKARLYLVRRDLEPIVDRLSPAILDWAPAPGMRTLGGQLVEIVATEMQLVELLRNDHRLADEEAAELIGDTTNLEVLRGALLSVRQQTLEYLDSLSPEALA